MSPRIDQITAIANHIHNTRSPNKPLMVAIAGAPASGKSTLAAEVARRLNDQKCETIVLPMDGFHLDNRQLEKRNLMQSKGAPDTFDVAGLTRLVKALRAGEDVYFPSFDRSRDISIAGAIHVSADTPVTIIEGNYLMYDAPVWRDLVPFWDVTVRLDVPMPELRARLIHRWLSHNLSSTVATQRAERNDIPNAQSVIDNTIPCDLNLTWSPQSWRLRAFRS